MPERFSVSKGVLRLDRFMTYVILVGGIGIIAAVFGIFVFIGSVIWTLPGVRETRTYAVMEEVKSTGMLPL